MVAEPYGIAPTLTTHINPKTPKPQNNEKKMNLIYIFAISRTSKNILVFAFVI
jgi:hypothetical protein